MVGVHHLGARKWDVDVIEELVFISAPADTANRDLVTAASLTINVIMHLVKVAVHRYAVFLMPYAGRRFRAS